MATESSLEVGDPIRPPAGRCPVLVGGVGYRWQSDASFGVVAVDELAEHRWPCGTDILDLGYGAIYVAEDLLAASPPYRKAIFLAGVPRGREPGHFYRWRWEDRRVDPEEVQERIREAGAGVVHLDHLLVVAEHFGALPPDVVVLEAEPVCTDPGEELSPEVDRLLPKAVRWVRREVEEVTEGGGGPAPPFPHAAEAG